MRVTKTILLTLLIGVAVLLAACGTRVGGQDNTPTAPTSAQNTSPSAAPPSSCQTTQEVAALTGVQVERVSGEACAFGLSKTPSGVTAICPKGWTCTWGIVNEGIVVQEGNNQSAKITAGTWRYPPAYPPGDAAHNVCMVFQLENAASHGKVKFKPIPGGKTCS